MGALAFVSGLLLFMGAVYGAQYGSILGGLLCAVFLIAGIVIFLGDDE